MRVREYQSNTTLQLVMNNINLSILFGKTPSSRHGKVNEKKNIFGFSQSEIEKITIAIRRGVNIIELLEKYVSRDGVKFLQNTFSKQEFINEIAD